MDDAARLRVLDDLDSESQELSRLVEEVVEVATDRRGDEAPHDVELGALVERVSQRAAQRSGRPVLVHLLEPATVTARPLALERAVANLVENALKFDDGDGPIEVTCEGGRVEVADRGPGIAAEDRERVFDRFFRSTEARSRPGSGLGLSIVSDVVQRKTSSMVVMPARTFARPAMRSEVMPMRIISCLSSAVEQPCSTSSFSWSRKGMTSYSATRPL
mgnify:CR=1 FL=1